MTREGNGRGGWWKGERLVMCIINQSYLYTCVIYVCMRAHMMCPCVQWGCKSFRNSFATKSGIQMLGNDLSPSLLLCTCYPGHNNSCHSAICRNIVRHRNRKTQTVHGRCIYNVCVRVRACVCVCACQILPLAPTTRHPKR